mgnify:CR=1 FL=1
MVVAMTIVVLTGVVAGLVASNLPLFFTIIRNPVLFYGLLIGEFIMVAIFSRSVDKVGYGTLAAGIDLDAAIARILPGWPDR